MLSRLEELLFKNLNFAFETTLASKTFKHTLQRAIEKGYTTTLLFFWLRDVRLAKERVRLRVLEGGHNIPEEVIERRYVNGIFNLFDIYIQNVHQVMIFDNSEGRHELIAEKVLNEELSVYNIEKFNSLYSYYDKRSTNRTKK